MHYMLVTAARLGLSVQAGKSVLLDFGCGDGRHTLPLVAEGYDAYGVDIDAAALGEAQDALRRERPDDFAERFRLMGEDGKIPFPDATFDYVYANMVVEHVADLETAFAEVARVMKPDAAFYSASPARFSPVEPHIFVPFAHWLGPGRLRTEYLRLCFRLGIGESNGQSAEFQNGYLEQHTFYRRTPALRRIASRYFHDVRFVAGAQLHAARSATRVIPEPLLDWAFQTFHTHRLLLSRPRRSPAGTA